MRAHWSVVVSRSQSYASRIGPTGLSGAAFARDVLFDVDPRDVDEVLTLLHRRKIIWVSRNRGAVHVYGERPERREREERSPLAAMLSAIAPHAYDAAFAIEARAEGIAEARERARVAAGRIARIALKHGRSAGLGAVRAALWLTFPEAVMKAVAFEAPALQRSSAVERIEPIESRPGRIARGLGLEEKVAALIEKAGVRGINRSGLLNGIRPVIDASTLEAVVGQLEAAGMIVSGEMRIGSTGRPGTRYFSAAVGLPYVTSKGEAVFSA